MDLKVTIKGNEEVSRDFKRRSKDMPKGISSAISKVSLIVERYGKIFSPVKTGLMRSTIYPVEINKFETWVGAKTEYAQFVHERKPFMTMARDIAMPSVDNIVRKELKEVLK